MPDFPKVPRKPKRKKSTASKSEALIEIMSMLQTADAERVALFRSFMDKMIEGTKVSHETQARIASSLENIGRKLVSNEPNLPRQGLVQLARDKLYSYSTQETGADIDARLVDALALLNEALSTTPTAEGPRGGDEVGGSAVGEECRCTGEHDADEEPRTFEDWYLELVESFEEIGASSGVITLEEFLDTIRGWFKEE